MVSLLSKWQNLVGVHSLTFAIHKTKLATTKQLFVSVCYGLRSIFASLPIFISIVNNMRVGKTTKRGVFAFRHTQIKNKLLHTVNSGRDE